MDGRCGLAAEIAEIRCRQLHADASRERVARQVMPGRGSAWRIVLRPNIRGIIDKVGNASSSARGVAPDGDVQPELFLLSGLARASGR